MDYMYYLNFLTLKIQLKFWEQVMGFSFSGLRLIIRLVYWTGSPEFIIMIGQIAKITYC